MSADYVVHPVADPNVSCFALFGVVGDALFVLFNVASFGVFGDAMMAFIDGQTVWFDVEMVAALRVMIWFWMMCVTEYGAVGDNAQAFIVRIVWSVGSFHFVPHRFRPIVPCKNLYTDKYKLSKSDKQRIYISNQRVMSDRIPFIHSVPAIHRSPFPNECCLELIGVAADALFVVFDGVGFGVYGVAMIECLNASAVVFIVDLSAISLRIIC